MSPQPDFVGDAFRGEAQLVDRLSGILVRLEKESAAASDLASPMGVA
jgi:hypothetical protein